MTGQGSAGGTALIMSPRCEYLRVARLLCGARANKSGRRQESTDKTRQCRWHSLDHVASMQAPGGVPAALKSKPSKDKAMQTAQSLYHDIQRGTWRCILYCYI